MTIIDPTTAGPGYLIRYRAGQRPILNDPRILEALNYARQGQHKRFTLALNHDATEYQAALYDEHDGFCMEWHGAGPTLTLAIRRLLGDVFGDWGLDDYATRFGRVVDQWHRADEESPAVLDRFVDGAPCR